MILFLIAIAYLAHAITVSLELSRRRQKLPPACRWRWYLPVLPLWLLFALNFVAACVRLPH